MTNFNLWSPQETDFLITSTQAGLTASQISQQLNAKKAAHVPGFNYTRTPEAVSRKAERLNLKSIKDNTPPISTVSSILATTPEERVQNTFEVLKQLQKQYRDDSKFVSTGINLPGPFIKILVLSDIHFPFARLDMLEQILIDHSDADIVVLNGDLMDAYALSAFHKDKRVPVIDEVICLFEFVKLCSQVFKKVILTEGNHSHRHKRVIGALSPEVTSYYQPDVLARIAHGECIGRDGLVHSLANFTNVYYPPTEPWWVQIGKTLFIHPHSKGSSKPGHTVYQWMNKFKERLGHGTFDSIVCGHTHLVYKGVVNNTLLIEQGCLADFMGYTWEPKQVYNNSASNGYAVIYQDREGNTDFNKSGPVYLGTLMPADKPIYNAEKQLLGEKIHAFFNE